MFQWNPADFLYSSSFKLSIITPPGLISVSFSLSLHNYARCIRLLNLDCFFCSFLAMWNAHGIVCQGSFICSVMLEEFLLASSVKFFNDILHLLFQVWPADRATDWNKWWDCCKPIFKTIWQDVRKVTLHPTSRFPGDWIMFLCSFFFNHTIMLYLSLM